MVYLDESRMTAILTTTGMYTKYPMLAQNKNASSLYILRQFGHHNKYQRLARKFINQCKKYSYGSATNIPGKESFADFLKRICVNDLYQFHCYYKYDISDFKCSQFLVDFFGQTLDFVLEKCNLINMESYLPYNIRNKPQMYQSMRKIMKIYLMISLAQIFTEIDFAMKSDLLIQYCNNGRLYSTAVNPCMQKEFFSIIKKNKNLDQILSTPDSDLNKVINQYQDNYEKNTEYIHETHQLLKLLYPNNSELYDYFINQTPMQIQEYCSKNPDMNALVGRYFIDKKTISKYFILKYVAINHFWVLLKVIGDISSIKEPVQILGIKMPSNIFNKKLLVIEI